MRTTNLINNITKMCVLLEYNSCMYYIGIIYTVFITFITFGSTNSI